MKTKMYGEIAGEKTLNQSIQAREISQETRNKINLILNKKNGNKTK